MVKRPKGYLSKTTRKLKARRKITPADFVREFNIGDRVAIDPYPYYKEGVVPHARYHGKVGTVVGKEGKVYVVELKTGGKTRKLKLLPIFLKKVAA